MKGSIIAGEIDREYRVKKFYERRKKIKEYENRECKKGSETNGE